MDKLTQKKTNAMLRAIVGFKIDILKIAGKYKMSQNKDLKNRESIIQGLNSIAETKSHKVSKIMSQSN